MLELVCVVIADVPNTLNPTAVVRARVEEVAVCLVG